MNTLECIDLSHHQQGTQNINGCYVAYPMQMDHQTCLCVKRLHAIFNTFKCVHVVLTLYMKENAG